VGASGAHMNFSPFPAFVDDLMPEDFTTSVEARLLAALNDANAAARNHSMTNNDAVYYAAVAKAAADLAASTRL